MSELILRLSKKKLIQLPNWLHYTNIHYLTIMGSKAYGCEDVHIKNKAADYDVYGWAMPPLERIFPSKAGHYIGFADWADPRAKIENNDPWQKHHIFESDSNKEWDFQIFGLIRYFELLRNGNPNVIDSLFTPESCVLHITDIGRLIRDNRHQFLSKKMWKTFRGYALSQLKKMDTKNPQGSRREIIDKFGFDVKFAYHIYRLYSEIEQVLTVQTIDLQQDKEVLKAIRRGEWSSKQIHEFVAEKDIVLEKLFTSCNLPDAPDINQLKKILTKSIEMHYGNINNYYNEPDWSIITLKKIKEIIDNHVDKLL